MKKLITAIDVRDSNAKGEKVIPIKSGYSIVTPEAMDVAKNLGIAFSDSSVECPQPSSLTKESGATAQPSVEKIKSEIQARVGNGVDNALLESLIQKAMADFDSKAPACSRQINDDGIVLVRGNTVELGEFDGAPGKNIGLTDVIGTEQNSTLGVGYMGWEKAFFPWTLNYDEVDVVLEGELHIKTESGTTIGKPGDVIFIPKNSNIEFGTPTHVRFVYVAYPADWAEQ